MSGTIVTYEEMPLSYRGVVRFQSNVDEHDPELCYKDVNTWEKDGACKTLPKFVPFGMNVSLGNHHRVYASIIV